MKKTLTILILCIPLLTSNALCQNTESIDSIDNDSWTKVSLRRNIQLENQSEPLEIAIQVNTNVQRFELMVTSSVHQGKLSIEIYDPKSEKQGNFSLGTQSNKKIVEEANGNIKKSLFEPLPGNWIIKIIPKEASGTIRIGTAIREY